jgi:hypothetical protein
MSSAAPTSSRRTTASAQGTGPGDAPPLFRFVIHFRLAPLGIPHRWERWAPGPDAAEQAALRELVGRYGPFGVIAGSVSVGAPKRVQRPAKARVGLFDPR